MNGSGFLDKRSVAQSANVSIRTVDRWLGAGLPSYRTSPGGKILLRWSDVEQWLMRSHKAGPDLNRLVEETVNDLRRRERFQTK